MQLHFSLKLVLLEAVRVGVLVEARVHWGWVGQRAVVRASERGKREKQAVGGVGRKGEPVVNNVCDMYVRLDMMCERNRKNEENYVKTA